MINVEKVRSDFPILSRKIRGHSLAYLDSAATSQKPAVVIDTLADFYRKYNANVHRGIHTLSQESTDLLESARKKVAHFVHAAKPENIIFTRNTTESLNLVAYAWGRKNLEAGDEILLTEMEHHSNLVPWQILAQEKKCELRFIRVKEDGTLDLTDLDRFVSAKTKLISVTHVSNALGTINPIRRFAQAAHAVGALFVVDAAQSAPHLPVDVRAFGADIVAFSAHKMLGPTGIGVLLAHDEILESMPPFLGGGDMIREVYLERSTWNDLPYKFEAGTPNYADIIAFGAAIDYIDSIGMENIRQHEQDLVRYALSALEEIAGITIYGPKEVSQRSGVVSFNLSSIHPHDLGTLLDEDGIAVRAGHHCCQPLMRRYGISGTTRASFYLYNTKEEIDRMVKSLYRANTLFGVCGPQKSSVSQTPQQQKKG